MNTTTPNTSTALAVHSASSYDLLMNAESLERLERIADLMSSGKTTVPAHLRGSKGDCFAIVLQSMQWGMNPIAVAQKTHLVNGTLGYEAQLVAAVINSSGAVKDRFAFEFFGPWEKVIGKFIVKKGEKGEYRVPGWSFADEEGCGVRVSATLKGEAVPRVLELLLAQARVRNSTLWADDPKQQLAYLAEKKWSRLYAPDVILGVYTADELADPAEKFMGMADVVGAATAPAQPDAKFYSDEEFEAKKAGWFAVLADGRKTHDGLFAFVESKGNRLTEAQKDILRAVTQSAQHSVQDVEPKQPTPDASVQAATSSVTYATVADRLHKAADADALDAAADLIGEVADAQQRAELTAIYDTRAAALAPQ